MRLSQIAAFLLSSVMALSSVDAIASAEAAATKKVKKTAVKQTTKVLSDTIIGQEDSKHFSQIGIASYYSVKLHGRKTASGEIFDKNKFTAAHKTLAFGSYVLVTNLQNGRKLIVRINDRGPYSHNRILDLSTRAAQELGMITRGVAQVKVEAIQVDKDGYILGNGAAALYELANKEGLSLKVREEGAVPTTVLKSAKYQKTDTPNNNAKPIRRPSSQTRNILKVIRLPDETQAKKVLSSINVTSAQIQPMGNTYEISLELASQQEMMQTKRQLSRLGYTVFSYVEE